MARPPLQKIATLATTPWWLSVLLALLVYLVLAGLAPRLLDDSPLADWSPALRALAPAAGLACLLPALFAWFLARRPGLPVEDQRSLEHLRALSRQDFEGLVAEAYRRQDYAVEERGGARQDGGIDLVLRRRGERTLVQCLHWTTRQVPAKVVRELYGVMQAEGAAAVKLVTCGDFSAAARTFAARKAVDLVGGVELLALVKALPLHPLRQEPDLHTSFRPVAKDVEVIPEPEQLPEPYAAPVVEVEPDCPRCQSKMVKRVAESGNAAGKAFWGCSRFPGCRGKRPVA